MARDLDALLQPLAAVAEPGLDSLDPRFSAITSLASHGQYGPAADQIEELLGLCIYDIRLLSIYLFQSFREAGIGGLVSVLAVVSALLGDSFEAVGPLKKREETFDRRLAWLFGAVTDALEYHATKQTPEWEAFCAGVTDETLEAITASVAQVLGQITARKLGHASNGVARLDGWLLKHAAALLGPVVAPPSSVDAGPMGAPSGDAGGSHAEASRREVALVASYRFLELTRKLRAFEALVHKRQFRRAALVADDLQQLIENFDPRSYFPEVFATFSALLSENVEPLSEHWNERESIAWKALGQFYQTDLDRFVQG